MSSLTITRPDDWHLHLRDVDVLRSTVPHSARHFARAVVMPNLVPPVTTTEQAAAYRDRILAAVPAGQRFEPLMTLYLTDNTPLDEVDRARRSGFIRAFKLYPAGATTNSGAGVTRVDAVTPVLERLAAVAMPLLIHGEVTDPEVDIFDREAVFIERVLEPLRQRVPTLKIVFEHITTSTAADYVASADGQLAATITPHHLLLNRNAIFAGGLRPDHYCLPVLKREENRRALVAAATSGNRCFFLGTDSAPHAIGNKRSACACAGIFNALVALPLYAEIFDNAGKLNRLEGFASFFGPDFYGLPRNRETITLEKAGWTVPQSLKFGKEELTPLRAGDEIAWRVAF